MNDWAFLSLVLLAVCSVLWAINYARRQAAIAAADPDMAWQVEHWRRNERTGYYVLALLMVAILAAERSLAS